MGINKGDNMNKGAIALTQLIDEIPGFSNLVKDKQVILPEKDWGGLKFYVSNGKTRINYKIILNFNDFYDIYINDELFANSGVGDVVNLFKWLTDRFNSTFCMLCKNKMTSKDLKEDPKVCIRCWDSLGEEE